VHCKIWTNYGFCGNQENGTPHLSYELMCKTEYFSRAWRIAQSTFKRYLGFEVLTAVVLNVVILWDTAPCSPYVNRPATGWFLTWMIFDPEDVGDMFLRCVGSHTNDTALQPTSWQHSLSNVTSWCVAAHNGTRGLQACFNFGSSGILIFLALQPFLRQRFLSVNSL
jgi:hypothetical protein